MEYILIKVDGEDLKAILDVNPSYEKYVTLEHRMRMLYLILRTALYVIIQAELLWYETYSTCLKLNGLKFNKYDPCIASRG